MNTPGPSEHDGDRILYGIAPHRINRRLLLAGLTALPLVALADSADAQKKPKPPKKGKRGREPQLTSAHWEGTGRIYFGDRGWVDIGISTTIEPFVRVKSESWVIGEPAAKRRTLMIEPAGAYILQDGKRTDLPAQQAAHERQQYGIYAYILGLGSETGKAPGNRRVMEKGFPEATLYYDGARVAIVDVVVDPPRTGAKVTERFTLTGELASGAARFPQKIAIMQDLRPTYDMQITKFEATYA